MKKYALKYIAAVFVLAYLSASVSCSVEALTEAAIKFAASHHHHDEDTASHEHETPEPAPSHHHDAAPNGDDSYNDFCCSQLNGILNHWKNTPLTAKSLFAVTTVSLVEQTSYVTPIATRGWQLHDKAPPFSPRHNLFYVINFPPHAPPSVPSC